MNVLVTGGYGFVGSYIAERFYKEGHSVFILDNLSTGLITNANFKHKFFKLDINSERCKEIFSSNSFDVVVHLAAQPDEEVSCGRPFEDAETNVIGLVNMLNLSQQYGVNRFIFMSSTSVYGEAGEIPVTETSPANPLTPHAAGKLTGEEYCRLFNEIHGLSTIVLRASNVYGPKQGMASRGGVVSQFIKQIITSNNISIYGSGNQTRDFIYVEDVADAVYRCVESDYCGVLNLASGTETSINSLVKLLTGLTDIGEIKSLPARAVDISKARIDNTRIKRELDWVPLYPVEEGLSKSLDWYRRNYKPPAGEKLQGGARRKEAGEKPSFLKDSIQYIENLLLFFFVVLIEINFPSMGDFFFIDPKLLYIILIGVVYGTRHSIIAVTLSSMVYIFGSLNEGKDLLSLFYDSNSLMRIAYYLFVGFFVGYTIDIKNRSVTTHEHKYKAVQEKLDFLTEVYNDTKLVKDELQKQIRMSEDSLARVYGIIKELDTLSADRIYNTAVQVLERIMKSNGIAIYTISKNKYFARLVANSNSISSKVSKSRRIEDSPELKALIENREIFVNKRLDPDLPVMAAPVEDSGTVLALLAIYDIEFESINLYYQNLLKIVANFISSSLSKAIRYEEATRSERYVAGTNILKKESFAEIVRSKIIASENEHSNFVLLKVDSSEDITELDGRIFNTIRDIDYIGFGRNDRLYILLTNTKEEEAKFVMKRLEDKGVKTTLSMGDDLVA